MTIIWIIIFILTPAGISAVTTVTGHRGQSVQIKCSYKSGYETNIKYLCRGECSAIWGTKDIPVRSGSAEDQRFSLDDHTAARVFTITITDLRPEDEGTYWCGIQRTKALPDLYTEILLLVKPDTPTTVSHSTYSPPSVQTQSTHLSSFPSTDLPKNVSVSIISSGHILDLDTVTVLYRVDLTTARLRINMELRDQIWRKRQSRNMDDPDYESTVLRPQPPDDDSCGVEDYENVTKAGLRAPPPDDDSSSAQDYENITDIGLNAPPPDDNSFSTDDYENITVTGKN
ncbi:CMRF35-like molecule 1 [Colossoma macropomum]|uniref:CMRF35-like molecule 1 n=1 Tax=Colossoma macropomum TaxID=42526 RepID=UPI001865675E|nr:CMRF35-like molecule 1 [Colossoma macropomum]